MSKIVMFLLTLLVALSWILVISKSSDAAEPSDSFYQWTLPNGDVSMTDDANHIPVEFKDVAVKRSFSQVGKDANVTEITIPGSEYQISLERSLERSREIEARTVTSPLVEGCNGPITVEQERRDHKERDNSYNSLFYVVRDSCGNVKSITRQNPQLQVIPIQ